MNKDTAKKRNAYLLGKKAEALACTHYERHGYQIVAKRFRRPGGEIDLIAHKKDILAVVEVKSRRRHPGYAPAEAVTPRNRRRIETCLDSFLSEHATYAECCVRFDIFTLQGEAVQLLTNAWWRGE